MNSHLAAIRSVGWRRALLLSGVWLAAFVGAFENTGMRPAYPQILRSFGGGSDVSLFSTVFMVGGFVTAMACAGAVRRTTVVRAFCIATSVQVVGLVICLGAADMWTFLLGRLVQGSGEGVLVTCVFFSISVFLPAGRPRSLGYASVSVAWLIASVLAPVVYWGIADRPWSFVLAVLIATSICSVGLVVLGRVRTEPGADQPATAEDRKVRTPGGLLQLAGIAVALFAFSQFAPALGSVGLVATLGAVVLVAVVLGSFRGRGLLRIRSGIFRFLVVRGVVSAVYSSGLSFAAVAMLSVTETDPTGVAAVTSLAAVGWTTGAVLQSRLVLLARRQLSLGLCVLAGGLIVFIGGLSAMTWVCGLGMLLAGIGIGVAANVLPGFISSIVPDSELAASLTGLEVVDTVATTVVLVVIGSIVSAGSVDGVPSSAAINGVYGGLAAAALLAAVSIARLRRPM